MPVYARVPGVRVESLGEMWAAYSPASRETLLLNDTSAAVLEILAEHGPLHESQLADILAADSMESPDHVAMALRDCWPPLLQAGLVRDAVAG